jgi:hypothetical protein
VANQVANLRQVGERLSGNQLTQGVAVMSSDARPPPRRIAPEPIFVRPLSVICLLGRNWSRLSDALPDSEE